MQSNELILGTTGFRWRTAHAARHIGLDVDLLSDAECVFQFNAQIANGAIDLGVAEQQLHRAQVAGFTVNLRRLCYDASECVPYPLGSSPIAVTQSRTNLPYCRVEMCGRSWNRLGNMNSMRIISGEFTQVMTDSRVFSVSSN